MSLAGAITALAAEKRAVGYKYDAEERVLARFEAFCRAEFPGLGTVTRASAEAWLASARQRGVRPATLQGLAAPVRELARWLGRRGTAGIRPARRACCPGPPATSRTSIPTRNWRRFSPRPTAADAVPRSRSGTWSCRCCSGRSTPAACALPKPGCCVPATSTPAPGSCRSATPRAARTGRCPSPGRCSHRLAGYRAQVAGQPGWDWFFPGSQAGLPLTLGNIYKNFRRFLWQARISQRSCIRCNIPRLA